MSLPTPPIQECMACFELLGKPNFINFDHKKSNYVQVVAQNLH
jgi:hypothetical protein